MGKGKKKNSKKDQVSDDLLDAAALSVKKFRKVTKQITKLSTGQKIVGGIVLIAAGLTYLAKQDFEADETPAPEPHSHDHALAHHHKAKPFAVEEHAASDEAGHAPRKPRKSIAAKHES
ncbi:hypothetical protein [Hymenobacter sp. BT770]|nr:hypothetical protein [Hymenobacter sp. BT770]